MNCHTHADRTGVAVCVNCGAGLCTDCCRKTDTRKNVCSEECAASAKAMDDAIHTIAARMGRSSNANAWFCWLLGAIFGVLGLFSLPHDLFLAVFLLAPCVVFIFVGFWYNNIARKPSNLSLQSGPAAGGRPLS